MGQGNIKYRKVKRTPQTGENAGKELWYATVVTDREMNFEEFVDHISSHNSPYSRGTVHGVMMDMLDCLKELILDGKSVRLGDLGLFSIGMSSHGEVSRDKVSAASVEGIHLLVKNTNINITYFVVPNIFCIFAPRIFKCINYEGNRLYSCFNEQSRLETTKRLD